MSVDVAIIDYKISNMFSVKSVCDHLGLEVVITGDRETILNAGAAILPGVGAFSRAMSQVKELGLDSTIKDFIEADKPFLGICLGMQLLLSKSAEFGECEGLGIIEGDVKKLPVEKNISKVPHIGWNNIHFDHPESPAWDSHPLTGLESGDHVYFDHSFYCDPVDKSLVTTTTQNGSHEFCSSFGRGNLYATQFHPEKSGLKGIEIFRNFANTVKTL